MHPEERDKIVSEFLSTVVNKISYCIENKIMNAFDVTFELGGKSYTLSLSENNIIDGKQLDTFLKN